MLRLLCLFACLQVAWLQIGPRATSGKTMGPKPTGGMTKGPMHRMTGGTMGPMMKPRFNTFSSKFQGSGPLRSKLHLHQSVASKIDEYSGKITASKDTTDPSKDKNRVEVSIYKCVEYDNSGNEIGKGPGAGSGTQSSHKVDPSALAAKKFNFGSTKNVTLGAKKTGGGMMDGKELNFSTTANNGARMEMMMITNEEDGSFPVGVNAENFEMKAGDIKFTMKVSGWTFCNSCNGGSQVGDHLKCSFKIRSRKPPVKKAAMNRLRAISGTGEEMDLGEGALMTISKQVKVDGSWRAMNSNYPIISTISGEESMMEIHIPKFNSDFEYDPTIGTTSASAAINVIISPALLLMALASRFF